MCSSDDFKIQFSSSEVRDLFLQDVKGMIDNVASMKKDPDSIVSDAALIERTELRLHLLYSEAQQAPIGF